jgi:competence protein ComEA
MNEQPSTREVDSRACSGPTAHASRGRAAAPRLLRWIPAQWLPIASKLGGGLLAALVLAIVGWGAHPRATSSGGAEPSLQSSLLAPSAPSVLAAETATAPEAGTAAAAPSAVNDSANDRAAPETPPSPASSPAVLPDGRIVLNLASAEDLRRLPGIGPTRARAIVELRQRLAKFRAVEDLMRVKGIGRKIIQRIKPGVVLDRPSEAVTGPAKSV